MSRVAIFVLVSFVLLTASASADVIVVDWANGPGADHTDLFPAIDASSDGDVILVRPGNYFMWNMVVGRSLTIAADGAPVVVNGLLTVRDLAANQSVVLRQLDVRYPGGLEVFDSEGVVVVEECKILGDLFGGTGVGGAVRVESARVVLEGSYVEGSWQYFNAGEPPTPALYAFESSVVVSGSQLVGGGGADTYGPDLPGAPALQAINSDIRVQGSFISGGNGFTESGGAGALLDADSAMWLRDNNIVGGPGAPSGVEFDAAPGAAVNSLTGTPVFVNAASPVREQESWSLQVDGPPGETAWALLGAPAWAPLPSGQGIVTTTALTIVPLGVFDGAGSLSIGATIPTLGFDALAFRIQVFVPLAGAPLTVGEGTNVVFLGPGF